MEENTNILTNEIIIDNNSDNIYKITNNIHTMLSVLSFIITIIFLFNYLKLSFSFKR